MRLLFPFAKRFIAGINTNDSSVVFKNHLDQNFKVIANLVGENIQSAEKIETICETYAELLDRFSDCLLYTSPSPRDRTRSRMPSSA